MCKKLTVIVLGTVLGRNDETVAHFAIDLPEREVSDSASAAERQQQQATTSR